MAFPSFAQNTWHRPAGSTFDPNWGYLHAQHVGAYNWVFDSGKTQTIYLRDSWTTTYTTESKVWFHDVFRKDRTPYDEKKSSASKA